MRVYRLTPSTQARATRSTDSHVAQSALGAHNLQAHRTRHPALRTRLTRLVRTRLTPEPIDATLVDA